MDLLVNEYMAKGKELNKDDRNEPEIFTLKKKKCLYLEIYLLR